MDLKKRLFNLARSELRSAARKMKRSAEDLLGGEESTDEHFERLAEEEAKERNKRRTVSVVTEEEKIRVYYANLELPIGASLAEVKASYRRLMRRYHPDLHQTDKDKAEIANRLAQELRVAYEGLVAHLEKKGR
jgi:DnaJ-domain-containing protein 1